MPLTRGHTVRVLFRRGGEEREVVFGSLESVWRNFNKAEGRRRQSRSNYEVVRMPVSKGRREQIVGLKTLTGRADIGVFRLDGRLPIVHTEAEKVRLRQQSEVGQGRLVDKVEQTPGAFIRKVQGRIGESTMQGQGTIAVGVIEAGGESQHC